MMTHLKVTGRRFLQTLAVGAMILTLSASSLAAEEGKSTLGLIGDSTVATTYGWGPAFAEQVKEQATVLNYAKNGATLDSLSKKLDSLITKKPDYILIQFGHNDMKRYDAKAYGVKLKNYVERIKRAGVQPIVLSSVTRRNFDDNGKIAPRIMFGDRSLRAFAKTAKVVAEETNVPFLDLNSIRTTVVLEDSAHLLITGIVFVVLACRFLRTI